MTWWLDGARTAARQMDAMFQRLAIEGFDRVRPSGAVEFSAVANK